MTIETKILETVSQMPQELKQELFHYAEYLLRNYSHAEPFPVVLEPLKKKRGGFGILKDKIWMADDFDEPLEDFKEYMSSKNFIVDVDES